MRAALDGEWAGGAQAGSVRWLQRSPLLISGTARRDWTRRAATD